MINVTENLKNVKLHKQSGIVWVQLGGDDGFEWLVTNHPDTPDGFVSIGGANNRSFRIIEKAAYKKMLNAGLL